MTDALDRRRRRLLDWSASAARLFLRLLHHLPRPDVVVLGVAENVIGIGFGDGKAFCFAPDQPQVRQDELDHLPHRLHVDVAGRDRPDWLEDLAVACRELERRHDPDALIPILRDELGLVAIVELGVLAARFQERAGQSEQHDPKVAVIVRLLTLDAAWRVTARDRRQFPIELGADGVDEITDDGRRHDRLDILGAASGFGRHRLGVLAGSFLAQVVQLSLEAIDRVVDLRHLLVGRDFDVHDVHAGVPPERRDCRRLVDVDHADDLGDVFIADTLDPREPGVRRVLVKFFSDDFADELLGVVQTLQDLPGARIHDVAQLQVAVAHLSPDSCLLDGEQGINDERESRLGLLRVLSGHFFLHGFLL